MKMVLNTGTLLYKNYGLSAGSYFIKNIQHCINLYDFCYLGRVKLTHKYIEW